MLAEGDQESPEFKRQRQQYQQVCGCASSSIITHTSTPDQVLESHGIRCVHKELADEDHFSVLEKLSDPNYSPLTKVSISLT